MLDASSIRIRYDDDNRDRWAKITDALDAIARVRRDAKIKIDLTRYAYYPKNTASLREE